MMKWFRWVEGGVLYFVIAAALAAGLAASYGRELEAKRQPDRQWWLRRLLIMPLLAIASATATDLFHLPTSVAAFSAAMLALGGYDVIRLMEARWRHKLMITELTAPPD